MALSSKELDEALLRLVEGLMAARALSSKELDEASLRLLQDFDAIKTRRSRVKDA